MVEFKTEMPPTASGAWPPGHRYGLPCKCRQMTGEKKIKYLQPERAVSYKPCKAYKSPEMKAPTDTTYKLSYEAFEPGLLRNCKGRITLPRENLAPAGSFSGLTTHKLSYGAWPGITRQMIYYPRDHKLSGEGPMAEVTTQKHDYTPKCIDTAPLIVRPNNIGLSREPMPDGTVMSMSYKCPDYERFQPPVSYKPVQRYMPPMSPLDGDTVHKMSYMPWEPQPKDDMPWARPAPYKAPGEPLDGSTIYAGSYLAPGRLVDDPDGHCKGCYCIYPAECMEGTGSKPEDDTCPSGYDPNVDPPRPPPVTE